MKTYKFVSSITFTLIFLASHTYCMQKTTQEKSLIELIQAQDLAEVQKKVEEHNADVNATEEILMQSHFRRFDSMVRTPLIEAIKTDNIKITRYLLEKGASVNVFFNNYCDHPTDNVRTAFEAAVKKHNLPMMQLLVQYGVDVKEEDNQARLLLYVCMTHRMTSFNSPQKITLEKIIHQLLEWNCNLSLQDSDNNKATPFQIFSVGVHAHSPKHTLQLLVAFLLRGAHFIADNRGTTPLMTACKYNNAFLVKTCLQNGAPIESQDTDGKTALFYIEGTHAEQELLMHGANIHHVDKKGNTLVHKFIKGCRWKLHPQMRFLLPLLDRHIDINAQNNEGDTPLHYAIQHQLGFEWIIPVLFFYGAEQSLFIKNKKNETPIDLIYKRKTHVYFLNHGLEILDPNFIKKMRDPKFIQKFPSYVNTAKLFQDDKSKDKKISWSMRGNNPMTQEMVECPTFADFERTILLHNCYLLPPIEYAKLETETKQSQESKEQTEQSKKQLKKRSNIYRRVRDREIGVKMPQRLYIQ